MLDPTQTYECDAGEVIALHGPDTDGEWLAILQIPSCGPWPVWVRSDGSHLNNDAYTLRPARPKLHVKCWLVVYHIDGVQFSATFYCKETAKTHARALSAGGHVPVAIRAIDETLTAGDGMEEQL